MLHFLNCPENRISFWCEQNSTQVVVEKDSSGWLDITVSPEILKNLALSLFFFKSEKISAKCYVYEECCEILERATDPLIRPTKPYAENKVEDLFNVFGIF
jgi:hypothetical protein